MARVLTHSIASTSLLLAVRTYFGLTQAELGRYFGMRGAYVAHLEAGRRRASPQTNLRLTRLAQLLPPPEGRGQAAPSARVFVLPAAKPLFNPELAGPATLAAGALHQRQRQCARRLAYLRRNLYVLASRAADEERRRWALPLLETLLVPTPHDPAADAPAEQAHLRRWLDELTTSLPVAPALRPDTDTALALLLVRIAALEAEIQTLTELLAKSA
ncbi:helix-turn-helix domain-containing protein [Hymenobacter terrenus]|uniref:helix-turn-helix domain-containing protein n=1 Tax=Hymenobacter terrenus TaxID=1629124 RepID=UPI000619F3B8|nr:helix-turn-helix transcriptional regulator [Hymenobacter terrenus]